MPIVSAVFRSLSLKIFWRQIIFHISLLLFFFPVNIFAQEKDYLDVSISIFDANLPATEQGQRELNIYPQVRATEVRYMPALLRATLLESDRWGAIRIVPVPDATAELMLSGRIINSDGLVLELEIVAKDSSGQEWINMTYVATAAEGVSLLEEGLNIDPFQRLYQQILDDLIQYYEQLSVSEIAHLKTLSQLRYAAALAPDAFADYLILSEESLYDYTRLPAAQDPLLARVEEIRQHEYIFVDVVDSQYQDFLAEVKPVYDLWRNYKKDLALNSLDFQDRQERGSQFRRGSYLALKGSYNNYRWQKMQGQFLDQLSQGFTNEVASTELDLEDSIYRLSGTMTEQYEQWREILKSLYELDVQ